jgi:soluble lytic murein transglycosylase
MSARLPLALSCLLLGAAAADPLPPGLVQQGGVISMQPVGEGDQTAADGEAGLRPGAHFLSPADHDLFVRAFDAADRGDWPQALALAGNGSNPMARMLIQWRFLQDKNAKAPFADIDAFLKNHPQWPRHGTLVTRAEEALDPASAPAAVIAWFGSRNPLSATGMIRLGEALIATGKQGWGTKLVRDGWAAGVFEPAQELAIVEKDGALLTPDVDRRRLDNLIWADQLTAAKRELARVDDASQRLAAARIALRSDPRGGQRVAAELAADLASDPQLLFDRARAARRLGDKDATLALLMATPWRELIKQRSFPVWNEVHIAARQALQDGKPDIAYQLVSNTGLTAGSEFADAEFISGWIALRFLKDPAAALPHFEKLAGGVSRPISMARGAYWLGRSYEALGDEAKAWQSYSTAAAAPETFYGQLALTRIEAAPVLRLKSARADAAPSSAAFERDELVQAMRVLGDVGAQGLLRAFALRYQELHPDLAHVKRLAQALTEMGFRDVALRLAKVTGYDGPSFAQYAYPVIPVPAYRGPGPAPEAALVHAIIRQETEFDPESVSRANARGIMQLTPASARLNAKRAGLPYKPNLLTTDVSYNMQLGMTEFSGYLSNWGNVAVAAAAYNAGESNAKRWIASFGDPRSGAIDPVDWIEAISYGETRNYVQRVVENLQVYRSRMGGRETPLRILSDLYAPNAAPQLKVLAQPAPVLVPAPVLEKKPPKIRR